MKLSKCFESFITLDSFESIDSFEKTSKQRKFWKNQIRIETDQRKYEKFQKLLKFRTFVVWFRCVFKFFLIVKMQNLAKIYVQIKVSHK